MRANVIALMIAVAATPAMAHSTLSGNRLIHILSGRTYTWPNGSTSTYGGDGSYVFEGKTMITGTWAVTGHNVCVTFTAGGVECARFYYRHGSLYALTAKGTSYRAR